MINKGHYKEKLEDLLIAGQTHAICSFKKKHIKECVKYCEDKGIGGCISCQEAFKNWLNAEHKEPIKITLFENLLLERFIEHKKGYQYIARDGHNRLWVFTDKPVKDEREFEWDSVTSYHSLYLFEDLFQFITWEDAEPTHIQTLLDNCEVIEDA